MLRDDQKTIAAWIRAPEGVAAALSEADSAPTAGNESSASRRLAALIRSDETLDAVGRLEIYANAYFHRILGVLRDDYPALCHAMGDDSFHDVVTSYLLVEPSDHPSLRYVGRRLPEFLSSHEAASGIRERSPWAADLAALEWARADVFDAPDGEALSREVLASLEPERFSALELRLGPWALVRSFSYPVDRHWRAATSEAETKLISDAATPTNMLVWRKRERVVHRVLTSPEYEAVLAASDGVSFVRLCELAATFFGDVEAPARSAAWLEQWLADGIIRASSGA